MCLHTWLRTLESCFRPKLFSVMLAAAGIFSPLVCYKSWNQLQLRSSRDLSDCLLWILSISRLCKPCENGTSALDIGSGTAANRGAREQYDDRSCPVLRSNIAKVWTLILPYSSSIMRNPDPSCKGTQLCKWILYPMSLFRWPWCRRICCMFCIRLLFVNTIDSEAMGSNQKSCWQTAAVWLCLTIDQKKAWWHWISLEHTHWSFYLYLVISDWNSHELSPQKIAMKKPTMKIAHILESTQACK